MTLDVSETNPRQEELLRRIESEGYVSIAAAAARLHVTEMTIRRDLRSLAELGLVRRVHGGASRPADIGTPFAQRAGAMLVAKRSIARNAVRHILPASTIALDSGTTIAQMPAEIGDHLDRLRELGAAHGGEKDADGREPKVVAVSHSVPIIAALAAEPRVTLIGLGGLFQLDTESFCGPATRAAIEELNLDLLFLSATGITEDGLHCGTPHDAETKRALIARARRVIVLADSTKLGHTAAVRVAALGAADLLITDAAVAPQMNTALRAAEVEIEVAKPQ